MEYREEELIKASEIKDFAYCRRRWALINLENKNPWKSGSYSKNKNSLNLMSGSSDSFLVKSYNVCSYSLGVYGVVDAVKFIKSDDGISLPEKSGLWNVLPIKFVDSNETELYAVSLQLCALAMCLEFTLCCEIEDGIILVKDTGETITIKFDENISKEVEIAFKEMHSYVSKSYTPQVKKNRKCKTCILCDTCLPELSEKKTVERYIDDYLKETA